MDLMDTNDYNMDDMDFTENSLHDPFSDEPDLITESNMDGFAADKSMNFSSVFEPDTLPSSALNAAGTITDVAAPASGVTAFAATMGLGQGGGINTLGKFFAQQLDNVDDDHTDLARMPLHQANIPMNGSARWGHMSSTAGNESSRVLGGFYAQPSAYVTICDL
jgi:hypothetical protein